MLLRWYIPEILSHVFHWTDCPIIAQLLPRLYNWGHVLRHFFRVKGFSCNCLANSSSAQTNSYQVFDTRPFYALHVYNLLMFRIPYNLLMFHISYNLYWCFTFHATFVLMFHIPYIPGIAFLCVFKTISSNFFITFSSFFSFSFSIYVFFFKYISFSLYILL